MKLFYYFFPTLLLSVNGSDAADKAVPKQHLRRSSAAGRNLSSRNNHHTCPSVVGSCPYHTSKILKCVNASSNKDCLYLGHCAAKKAGFTVDTDCEVISSNNNSGSGGADQTGPTTSPTEVPTVAPTVAPTIAPTNIPTVSPTGTPTFAPTVAPVTTCKESCEVDAEEDKEACLQAETCMSYAFGMSTLEECCEATKVSNLAFCHLICDGGPTN